MRRRRPRGRPRYPTSPRPRSPKERRGGGAWWWYVIGRKRQLEGRGRQERGRRPIHARAGRAARRNPPPTDRTMARAASRPPRRLVGRPERQRPSKSERSQSERADVHGSGVGALSHVQRGAPRCTTPTNSSATGVRLSRATRRLARDAEIHHPHPTSASACLRACALCVLRACAARRAQRRGAPPLRARVRASADSRAPRRGGGRTRHRDLPPNCN